MSEAAKSLKKAHDHINMDEVHDMMDSIAEQQEISKAISSNPDAFGQDLDEEDPEAKLEKEVSTSRCPQQYFEIYYRAIFKAQIVDWFLISIV